MIRQEIDSSSILRQERNIRVEFNENMPLYIWADEFMTEEVITNYLTNAIHYVRDNGLIKIWYEKQSENTVRICVYNEKSSAYKI